MSWKKPVSKHHRKCRSNGGNSNPGNISYVKVHEHRAFHILFANKTAEEIAKILTDVWIDPAWKLTATKK